MTANMQAVREICCPDPEALAEALAARLATRLRSAVEARGEALIAVSGGRSPQRLFAALSQSALPWAAVTVAQVDERWLPADHPDSNAAFIRQHLLCGPAAAAHFLSLKNEAETPEIGQASCETQMRECALPFDAVVLGMGEDGHTASLFPHAPELASGLDPNGPLCVAVRPTHAPHPRMSLSLAGLLSSRLLILFLHGQTKLAAFRKAQEAGPVDAMPIRAVLRQRRVPLEIWYSP